MRTLFLAAALAAPLAVSAQSTPADVWPLAPGNTWTYTSYYQYSSTSGGGGESRLDGAVTWTVLDSVQTAVGRLLRVDFGAGQCLVQTRRTNGVVNFRLLTVAGNAPCTTQPVFTVSGPDFSVPRRSVSVQTLSVGGMAVPIDTTREGSDSNGSVSISQDVAWRTVDGIGVVGFSEFRHTTGTSNTARSATLRQATIGGQTIG